ncbi:MAG: thioredoxin TrxA [Candidatus Dasytiphilus stammeri]
MSAKIIYVHDNNFEDYVLKEDNRVTLVEFWAEWCGPCKGMAPILEEIAEEYKNQLNVAKLNVDKNPVTTQKYGIRGIPTLLVFKNGKLLDTKVGILTLGKMKEFLNQFFINDPE